jgi:tripartite-type tricarboxylate transporter receptor subunit TctC
VQETSFIISGEPGSLFDRIGQALVEPLRQASGGRVVPRNAGDSSGVGGAEAGASAPKDGSTLIMCNKGAMTSHPHTAKTYQPSDFVPLCQVADAPIAIAVRGGGPYDSLKSLFAAASTKPEGVSFSTPNPYHTQRLALADFAQRHRIRLNYVQLPGSNAVAIRNLVDGVVDFAFLAAHNLVEAREKGDIRVIGVAHPSRLEFLPDDPTFVEQGYDLVTAIWLGLFSPAGVPAPALERLRSQACEAASGAQAASHIRALHMVPAFADSDAFGSKVAADTQFHFNVLRQLGAV